MFAAPITLMHSKPGTRRNRIPGIAGAFSAGDLERMLSAPDMRELYDLVGRGNIAAAAQLVRERAASYLASAPAPAVAAEPVERPRSRAAVRARFA